MMRVSCRGGGADLARIQSLVFNSQSLILEVNNILIGLNLSNTYSSSRYTGYYGLT